jgi:hypothetical protein
VAHALLYKKSSFAATVPDITESLIITGKAQNLINSRASF